MIQFTWYSYVERTTSTRIEYQVRDTYDSFATSGAFIVVRLVFVVPKKVNTLGCFIQPYVNEALDEVAQKAIISLFLTKTTRVLPAVVPDQACGQDAVVAAALVCVYFLLKNGYQVFET